nr:SPASM domain-containing protein [Candidatus Sigynarchaeota archaeon]
MDPGLVISVLNEAKEIGTKMAGFTGGEALTYKDEILAILTATKHLELKYSIATNCSFASDYKTTKHLLERFHALGLASLFMSYDPYHGTFIKKENIINAINACHETGVHPRLYIHSTASDMFDLARELTQEVFEGLDVISGKIIPIGRGETVPIPNEDWNEQYFMGFCDTRSSLMVHPNGDVYPCCAVGNDSKNMILGNLHSTSLHEIVRTYRESPFFRYIKTKGSKAIHDVALKLEPGLRQYRFV